MARQDNALRLVIVDDSVEDAEAIVSGLRNAGIAVRPLRPATLEELDAAREAGLQTVLLDRHEDYPQPRTGDATGGHRRVERFDEIDAG